MGFIFPRGKFSRNRPNREKRENYPHAKISTFTVSKMFIREMVSFLIKMSRYLYKDQGMINNLSTLCTVKYLFR